VNYAKKLTISVDKSRSEMTLKELLSGDIRKTGVKSIDSLIQVMKKEKEREKTKIKEIEKVKQLDLIKQAQLTNLDTEISLLQF
jgi:hypothetical protein